MTLFVEKGGLELNNWSLKFVICSAFILLKNDKSNLIEFINILAHTILSSLG